MTEIYRHITDYIQFLCAELGLYVSVHNLPLGVTDLLCSCNMLCNHHTNPYCIAMKNNAAFSARCRQMQFAVAEHCAGKSERCFGMCHAGVCEYLYPVPWGTQTGFISVSGYRPAQDALLYAKAMHKIGKMTAEFGLEAARTLSLYTKYLSEELPDTARLDVLIHPLQDMLTQAIAVSVQDEGMRGETEGSGSVLFQKIYTYLMLHYNQKISMEELCRTLNYSESYISRVFREGSGRSIQRYVQELRTEEAKLLLTTTDMTVQEIALHVGFGDSNYFSTVFRSVIGISPRTWRRLNRTNKKAPQQG